LIGEVEVLITITAALVKRKHSLTPTDRKFGENIANLTTDASVIFAQRLKLIDLN